MKIITDFLQLIIYEDIGLKMRLLNVHVLLLIIVCFVSCQNSTSKTNEIPVDQTHCIYYGGDMLTMSSLEPEYIEALVVKEGKIAFVGTLNEAEKQFSDARKVNLQGKTLLPGFIDSHSHFSQTAIKLSVVGLDPPPAGDAGSVAEIKTLIKKELLGNPGKYQEESDWILGWGFDHSMLAEKRFPNRSDLDEISTEFPIALIHFSSHVLVMNSKGLERAGYLSDDFKIPDGGAMQYYKNSKEFNGVIEEYAMLPGLSQIGSDVSGIPGKYLNIPLPDELMKEKLLEAQELYASEGFTTVTDMATTDDVYKKIVELGDDNQLKLDVAMGYFAALTTPEQVKSLYSPVYKNHYRVMGGKINLDGGSPGRTAYLRLPYHTPTPGQPVNYRGYSAVKDQKYLNELIASYYELQIPFFIHALGDAAVDQCIEAVKYSEENTLFQDARTQIIHAQQVQPDQFVALKDLDVTFTFQAAHNYYFSDFHNEYIYGPERTARLNPAKEALDHGFSVTIHHDSPVHPVDQIFLMWIAVNRKSRSGVVYGQDQRLTPYEALYASTYAAAYQLREEDTKGSLEVGKLADLVILNSNLLKIDPDAIKDISVVETIKKGVSIYKK